jgi:hypothetical protein
MSDKGLSPNFTTCGAVLTDQIADFHIWLSRMIPKLLLFDVCGTEQYLAA